MKHVRLFSLLTVLVFLLSSAYAQKLPPTVQTPLVEGVPDEVSGIRHATHTTGPIVVNWHFKNAPGSANLTVNPDGTYRFSGNYKRKLEGGTLEVVLGLKRSLGGVYLFHYTGNVSHGGVQWSKQGKDAFLKDDFKTFTKHDWIESYRFRLTAEGEKAFAQRKEACEDLAKQWHLPNGWIGGQRGIATATSSWAAAAGRGQTSGAQLSRTRT